MRPHGDELHHGTELNVGVGFASHRTTCQYDQSGAQTFAPKAGHVLYETRDWQRFILQGLVDHLVHVP